MKKITIIIAWMLFSLSSYAQFDPETQLGIEYNNLNQQLKQQRNEIGSIIKSEVEAQIKQSQTQTTQSQTQMMQSQTQTARQRTLENFNTRISNEGQIRMEHINNPDVYIDRSITNRKPSIDAISTNSTNMYHTPNKSSDLRTQPVHSDELTSKSLQMLREANREYFSNEDREETINPNAQVPLFNAPSLGVPLWQDLDEEMDMETVYSELSPGQKATYDKMKKEILERKENDLIKAEVLAELSKEIRSEMFASRVPDVAGAVYAIWAENIKENAITREQKELCQLNELAREAVQNKKKK